MIEIVFSASFFILIVCDFTLKRNTLKRKLFICEIKLPLRLVQMNFISKDFFKVSAKDMHLIRWP